MRLSIIIVTFNHQLSIQESLKLLLKNLPSQAEVIVVDNASSDGTVEEVSQFQNVKLIKSSQNLGFSKGCNLGVESSLGKYLLFLNPDTRVDDNQIVELLKFLEDRPEVGLVAPKLVLENGQIQPSATKLPTLWGAIRKYYFHQTHSYGEYIPDGLEPVEVEAVYGAAIMISRKNFEKVGRFDERYFLYFEDLDLCRRLAKMDLKIYYLPQIKIIHSLGESTKKISHSKLPVFVRTLALFWPIKSSGAQYYQIKSGNIYHGLLVAFLIRLVIFTGVRLFKI